MECAADCRGSALVCCDVIGRSDNGAGGQLARALIARTMAVQVFLCVLARALMLCNGLG